MYEKPSGGYLSYNAAQIEQRDDIRKLMIGTPLLLIVVFSFGFLLVHPSGTSVDQATAAKSDAPQKTPAASQSSTGQMAPLPLAATSLPTLPPAAAVDDSTASSASSNSSSGSSTAATAKATYKKSVAAKPKPDAKKASSLLPTVVNGVMNGDQ